MKVRMYPHLSEMSGNASGVAQVILHLFKYLPEYGIELVAPDAMSYDLDAAHAAARPGALVNHSHGLLWTAEYKMSDYAHKTNAELVQAIRLAREVTVPSAWVAQTFRRDMHLSPHVIGWGVEWDEWQHDRENLGYVLWGKNRTSDGLDPRALVDIAKAFPSVEFVSTFAPLDAPPNVKSFNSAIPHEQMKILIQQAAVVVATDKETWGIMPVEAMAAGVPVLSVGAGAVPELVQHQVGGYVFRQGDLQDAIQGLDYCLRYRDILSTNARSLSRAFTWDKTARRIADVYELAYRGEPLSVDIIIPAHNYAGSLGAAIRSALEQRGPVATVYVVDDNSTDGTAAVARDWVDRSRGRVRYERVAYHNVAETRNHGLRLSSAKYVVFLDADDRLEPGFVERLLPALEEDPGAGLAYTGIRVTLPDGTELLPWDWPDEQKGSLIGRQWPQPYDYAQQMARANQIPTCCLVRRKAAERIGGFRPRYAPQGAGSEDAEFFLRLGANGWGATYVPSRPDALFVHSHGNGNVSGNAAYAEPDWTAWHPWTKDGQHPFASIAEPANKLSHPVRFYDESVVSVVIPVGAGHEKRVALALDSLEAQTFRYWEAVVVWDSHEDPKPFLAPYPYAKIVFPVAPGSGTGAARNRGVEAANSPLVAFLDADDHYHPRFLESALDAFNQTGNVIYTDFVSRLREQDHARYGGTIIGQNKKAGTVLVGDAFADYDCQRARQRPEGERPYVWSGVTLLLPKKWHREMGGFDEKMASWEDCDYLLRLAWAGHCFTRIADQLWLYDFTSGGRRENADTPKLMKQLQARYDGLNKEGKIMACNCDKSQKTIISPSATIENSNKDLVVFYASGNRGKHRVVGVATKREYGYRPGGVLLNVAPEDVRARPDLFACPNCRQPFAVTRDGQISCPRCGSLGAPQTPRQKTPVRQAAPPPAPAPVPVEVKEEPPLAPSAWAQRTPPTIAEANFGRKVNNNHKKILIGGGIETSRDVLLAGSAGLTAIKGIGETVADTLLQWARDVD